MGPTGVPVYNLSAGCAAGGNAFNIGYTLVASGSTMWSRRRRREDAEGFIQTSGVEEATDPEFLRQRCVGVSGAPSGDVCRRRMEDHGTTENTWQRSR
jgi:acetyl-CoA acetyltransferase